MSEHLSSGMAGTEGTPGAADVARAPHGGAYSAFDEHHPPDAALVGDCVHCGFCLPTCPTYLLWGEEMDSPRGRIHLMKTGLEGEPMSGSMVSHFDACLGCMACVSSCPSGVQYDKLLTDTRAQVERRHERSRGDAALRNAIFAVFPYPKRLRLLRGPLALYQRTGLGRLLRRSGLFDRLSPTLKVMESLAPRLTRREKLPARVPASGTRRAVVGMLTGCVQDAFFPDVNAATARVLAAEGCDVVIPRGQGCCGALSQHMGREDESVAFARAAIDAFDAAGVEHVVVNAAGCGSAMKEYAHVLRDDPEYASRASSFVERVRDVSELLVELGPVAPRHRLDLTVAYHDACHLGHAQGIRSQPRELLRAVPGLELKEIVEPDICCGSAGVYNLLHPEPATELGHRKARNVLATGATVLVTANPGCLMQIASAVQRQGADIALAHTVAVLDASIRGVPLFS
ncbi:MAG TPA: heterodisulfide reductase-related iron-sulfur binding cluster [Pseudonocardiaceae bacterium]|nr:heterodisulfide reductase-related iron-sulfur binding cluster [Pseudonocardiaceae bacterium]